jgi:hypothetical protein
MSKRRQDGNFARCNRVALVSGDQEKRKKLATKYKVNKTYGYERYAGLPIRAQDAAAVQYILRFAMPYFVYASRRERKSALYWRRRSGKKLTKSKIQRSGYVIVCPFIGK